MRSTLPAFLTIVFLAAPAHAKRTIETEPSEESRRVSFTTDVRARTFAYFMSTQPRWLPFLLDQVRHDQKASQCPPEDPAKGEDGCESESGIRYMGSARFGIDSETGKPVVILDELYVRYGLRVLYLNGQVEFDEKFALTQIGPVHFSMAEEPVIDTGLMGGSWFDAKTGKPVAGLGTFYDTEKTYFIEPDPQGYVLVGDQRVVVREKGDCHSFLAGTRVLQQFCARDAVPFLPIPGLTAERFRAGPPKLSWLASERQKIVSERSQQHAADWEPVVREDEMDGDKVYAVFRRADRDINDSEEKPTRPHMMVRCRNKVVDVGIGIDTMMETEKVRYRFDDDKATTTTLNEASSGKLWFFKNGKSLAKKLLKHDSMKLEVEVYGRAPQVTEFDLTGLRTALGNLDAPCKW